MCLVLDHTTIGHPICYADAAYGNETIDRRTTYGYAILIITAEQEDSNDDAAKGRVYVI